MVKVIIDNIPSSFHNDTIRICNETNVKVLDIIWQGRINKDLTSRTEPMSCRFDKIPLFDISILIEADTSKQLEFVAYTIKQHKEHIEKLTKILVGVEYEKS